MHLQGCVHRIHSRRQKRTGFGTIGASARDGRQPAAARRLSTSAAAAASAAGAATGFLRARFTFSSFQFSTLCSLSVDSFFGLRAGAEWGAKRAPGLGCTACPVQRHGHFGRCFAVPSGWAHGISAVVVDGHLGRLGPAGRALDRAAALGGHQQGDQIFPVGHFQRLDDLFGIAGLVVLQQRTLQCLCRGVFFPQTPASGVYGSRPV